MSDPDNIFTDGAQLGPIVNEIVDSIVANSDYVETDTEIVALRKVATELVAVTDAFVDLDSYPPGVPNVKALKERIVAALAGANITNGAQTIKIAALRDEEGFLPDQKDAEFS